MPITPSRLFPVEVGALSITLYWRGDESGWSLQIKHAPPGHILAAVVPDLYSRLTLLEAADVVAATLDGVQAPL